MLDLAATGVALDRGVRGARSDCTSNRHTYVIRLMIFVMVTSFNRSRSFPLQKITNTCQYRHVKQTLATPITLVCGLILMRIHT
jgi:hypothetical protein